MNAQKLANLVLCFLVSSTTAAFGQDIDKELSKLADKLAVEIKSAAKKKIAVVDFTDLQGTPEGELGKYIAEQLTVDLVIAKSDFSVLDRANLNRLLAEHKLTATGLVDPDNAKKLGKFAGVDAFVLGTILPKSESISLNAKIVTTETAEIPGVARGEFKIDDTVRALILKPAVTESLLRDPKEQPAIVKSFGDIFFELKWLRVTPNGQYLLSFTITNRNPKPLLAALYMNSGSMNHPLKSIVADPEGFEFHSNDDDVSGFAAGDPDRISGYMGGATRVNSKQTVPVTIKFSTRPGRMAMPGKCRLQLEMLFMVPDGYGGMKDIVRRTIITEMDAKPYENRSQRSANQSE